MWDVLGLSDMVHGEREGVRADYGNEPALEFSSLNRCPISQCTA